MKWSRVMFAALAVLLLLGAGAVIVSGGGWWAAVKVIGFVAASIVAGILATRTD